MDMSQVIAQNLSKWMAEFPHRRTLEEVAQDAGVGFGTVRRAKTGDGNLTIANLEAIAKAFGRTARDLLVISDPTPQGTAYDAAQPARVLLAREPDPDEIALLTGYRAASQEVREIMLDLALKACRKKGASPQRNSSQ